MTRLVLFALIKCTSLFAQQLKAYHDPISYVYAQPWLGGSVCRQTHYLISTAIKGLPWPILLSFCPALTREVLFAPFKHTSLFAQQLNTCHAPHSQIYTQSGLGWLCLPQSNALAYLLSNQRLSMARLTKSGNTKGGKYHYTIDVLFDWFGSVCFANKNKSCQLSYSWFQTSQPGRQWYNDTSPFSIPWLSLCPAMTRVVLFATVKHTSLFTSGCKKVL